MIKLLFVFLSWAPSESDSLRLETIDGKQYIIHQVEAKETLYAISRRYNVPVTVILANNPSSDGGISVGKLLRLPYTPKSKQPTTSGQTHVVAQGETLYSIARLYNVSVDDVKKRNNLTENEISLGQSLSIGKKVAVVEAAPKLITQQSVNSTHTVAAKETLYSLARQYGVTVQQLKEWNNLTTDELKLGSIIYVVQPVNNGVQQPSATQTGSIVTQASLKINERIIGTEEVKEQGMAQLMEGTDGNRKYLAQHKTIRPGTILKVKNLTTNQEVFVRISSVLTGADSDVIMRLSKSAYLQLGGEEGKMKIEVTSYK